MPFIHTMTTKALDKATETRLKDAYGEIITEFPGKSERWLMLAFSPETSLYFQGNADGDTAMVEVKLYGKADADACERVTARICRLLSEELGLSPDRIYVTYEPLSLWGWNGANF